MAGDDREPTVARLPSREHLLLLLVLLVAIGPTRVAVAAAAWVLGDAGLHQWRANGRGQPGRSRRRYRLTHTLWAAAVLVASAGLASSQLPRWLPTVATMLLALAWAVSRPARTAEASRLGVPPILLPGGKLNSALTRIAGLWSTRTGPIINVGVSLVLATLVVLGPIEPPEPVRFFACDYLADGSSIVPMCEAPDVVASAGRASEPANDVAEEGDGLLATASEPSPPASTANVTAPSPMPTLEPAREVHPTDKCANEEAFFAAAGVTTVTVAMKVVWKKLGARVVGCSFEPPTHFPHVSVLRLRGGISDPSLLVYSSASGVTAAVFDDREGIQPRLDLVTAVEPRRSFGRGLVQIVRYEDDQCELGLRLIADGPVQRVLPAAATRAAVEQSVREGAIPFRIKESVPVEDRTRFLIEVFYAHGPALGDRGTIEVGLSPDEMTATVPAGRFGTSCPDATTMDSFYISADALRRHFDPFRDTED